MGRLGPSRHSSRHLVQDFHVFGVHFAPRVIPGAPKPQIWPKESADEKAVAALFRMHATCIPGRSCSVHQAGRPAKTNAQDKQAEKPAKGTKTVTGCLQKGDEAGEFSIEGEDGKLWGLRSSTVKRRLSWKTTLATK